MLLGKVIGTVVATQKYETLKALALRVIQPCDDQENPQGEPVVACDPIQSREGDLVLWVAKREASVALPGATLVNMYPVDATITGLVDWVGDRRK
ncbi:MAG: EutN/CcmL family microcompartment protein [Bdellovibrionota bacterium]